MLRLAVFASGRGSNLEAIYKNIRDGSVTGVEVALVISNNSASGAIKFAQEKNVPSLHISLLRCNNDEEVLADNIGQALAEFRVDLIVLAGYMKKLPSRVIAAYRGKILNIHPALLPEFGGIGMYGMNVHRAVIEAGKKISGATVHLVAGEYDSGEILLQESCDVLASDTPELLAERIMPIEHRILPKAIQIIANKLNRTK